MVVQEGVLRVFKISVPEARIVCRIAAQVAEEALLALVRDTDCRSGSLDAHSGSRCTSLHAPGYLCEEGAAEARSSRSSSSSVASASDSLCKERDGITG